MKRKWIRLQPLFQLTAAEQRLVLGILILALLGMTARHLHLRRQSQTTTPVQSTEQRTWSP